MPVCKHFLRGNCRFGDKCRDEHPSSNSQRGGNSGYSASPHGFQSSNRFNPFNDGNGGDRSRQPSGGGTGGGIQDALPDQNSVEVKAMVQAIRKDLTEERPQWPFSSYGAQELPCLGHTKLDQSPEEIHMMFLMNPQHALRFVREHSEKCAGALEKTMSNLIPSAQLFVRAKKVRDRAREERAEEERRTGGFFGMGGARPQQQQNAFGAANSGGAFGAGSSPFGGGQQQQQQQQQQPSSFGALPRPSAFGGQQQQQQPSAFGAPPQQPSPFGSLPRPSAFGAQPQQQPSAFGAQPQQQPSAFGAQPQPPSAFGAQQARSAFGAPVQQPSAFGAPQPSQGGAGIGAFGQSANGFGSQQPPPAFGNDQMGRPTTSFGAQQQQQPAPFGGAQQPQPPAFASATQQQQPSSPFGNPMPQANGFAGAPPAQGPTSSPFTNGTGAFGAASQQQPQATSAAVAPTTAPTGGSQDKTGPYGLSGQDYQALCAPRFELGRIPVGPPPKELC